MVHVHRVAAHIGVVGVVVAPVMLVAGVVVGVISAGVIWTEPLK
jgi:hypothetical protein